MISDGDERGYLAVLFFGVVGIGMCVLNLLLGGRLELGPTGMIETVLGRRRTYDWDKCGEFAIWTSSRNKMVVFDYQGSRRTLNARLSGRTNYLRETFGMDAEALAELLNTYRR